MQFPRELTFFDLLLLVKNNRRKIIMWAVVMGCALFFLRLTREPVFESEALFADGRGKGQGNDLLLKKLKFNIPGFSFDEGYAKSAFLSHKILGDVVESLGLQVKRQKSPLLRRVWDNLKAECGVPLQELGELPFRVLRYEGEKPFSFSLTYTGNEHYLVKDGSGVLLGKGRIGVRENFGPLEFCLTHKPIKNHFTVYPKLIAIKELRKKVSIKNTKEESTLLFCTCKERNRLLAKEVLSELFKSYQKSLKSDNQKEMHDEIAMLSHHRDSLMNSYESELIAYAELLEEAATKGTFFSAETEKKVVMQNWLNLEEALSQIKLERAALKGAPCAFSTAVSTHAKKIETLSLQKLDLQRRFQEVKRDLPPLFQVCKLTLPGEDKEEFAALDLKCAENFLTEYQKKSDHLQSQIIELERLKKRFSLSCARTLFGGEHKLIKEALEYERALHDSSNFSEKERERMKNELLLVTKLLLDETANKEESRRGELALIKRKIAALKERLTELYEEEVAMLDRQLTETVSARLLQLDLEEREVVKKRDEMRLVMEKLPQKKLLEKKLEFKRDLNEKILEQLVAFIESKSVEQRMEKSRSKVLDPPYTPLAPLKPYLLFYTLFGMGLGALMRVIYMLFLEIHTEFDRESL